jgi:hypothetical protein
VIRRRHSNGPKSFYAPAIVYDYAVDGGQYVGDAVHAGLSATKTSFRHPRGAEPYIEKYPVGSEVTVAYDPTDPSNAVLEPGQGGGQAAIMLAVGLGFFVIGLCLAGGFTVALIAGD